MGINRLSPSSNGDGHKSHLDPQERARKVADDLSSRFSDLNDLWLRAEKELRRIAIPLDVVHTYLLTPVYIEHPGGPQFCFHIGFAKTHDGWRICHRETRDDCPEEESYWKPITECSLDLRVNLIKHLPKLREKVLQEAEQCVPKLDEAVKDFRSVIGSW